MLRLHAILHDASDFIADYTHKGTYPSGFLSQIFVAIKLRFLLGKFYAKGKEKTESLQTLLQKKVKELETLLCPKIEDIKLPIDNITCTLPTYQKSKRGNIVLKGKLSCISIGSPCHPMSRRVEKAAPSVLQVNLSPSLTVCSCITKKNQLTLAFFKS